MRIGKNNMRVETAGMDDNSGNNWYKIKIDLPQLHLESPILFTVEYGNELIDKIDKLDDICPHCNKKI